MNAFYYNFINKFVNFEYFPSKLLLLRFYLNVFTFFLITM